MYTSALSSACSDWIDEKPTLQLVQTNGSIAMTTLMTRRSALGRVAGGAAFPSASIASLAGRLTAAGVQVKSRVRHSVCKWCYPKVSLDDLCTAQRFRDKLRELYGAQRGDAVQHAEDIRDLRIRASPDRGGIRRLFPFFGQS